MAQQQQPQAPKASAPKPAPAIKRIKDPSMSAPPPRGAGGDCIGSLRVRCKELKASIVKAQELGVPAVLAKAQTAAVDAVGSVVTFQEMALRRFSREERKQSAVITRMALDNASDLARERQYFSAAERIQDEKNTARDLESRARRAIRDNVVKELASQAESRAAEAATKIEALKALHPKVELELCIPDAPSQDESRAIDALERQVRAMPVSARAQRAANLLAAALEVGNEALQMRIVRALEPMCRTIYEEGTAKLSWSQRRDKLSGSDAQREVDCAREFCLKSQQLRERRENPAALRVAAELYSKILELFCKTCGFDASDTEMSTIHQRRTRYQGRKPFRSTEVVEDWAGKFIERRTALTLSPWSEELQPEPAK